MALLLGVALLFATAGLLDGGSLGAAGAGETAPLLRWGLAEVVSRLRQGVANVAGNPRAFPRKSDGLVLLGSLAFVLPALSRLGLKSSILANILLGIIIGPSGFCIFQNTSWSETLAQAGMLFFLCEMGLELNFGRLKRVWRDVFLLGAGQVLATTWALYAVGRRLLDLPRLPAFIFGAAFSLSSSAFVLQILSEHRERGTRHGRAAFGMLLMQDLSVPLLLTLLPMLRDVSGGLGQAVPAIQQAVLRTILALVIASVNGRLVLGWLFSFVAAAGSPVALRCLSFLAVFGTCFIFEAFGLPSTLGAFLAGVFLAETAYRQQVDAVIAPLREDFFGVFFITVGFMIDLHLVFTQPVLVLSTVATLLLAKSLVTMLACRLSGLSGAKAIQIGLLLSQAGEFSLVMINTAAAQGLFTPMQHRLLTTAVGGSLICTPLLAKIGRSTAEFLEHTQEAGAETRAAEYDGGAEVVVFGYGRIAKMITTVLDERLVRWTAFDADPSVVERARRKHLPVFFGDVRQLAQRPASRSAVGNARMVVVTSTDRKSHRVATDFKRARADVAVLVSVADLAQAQALERTGVIPITPRLPEDSPVLNLPLAMAVLEKLGYSQDEINLTMREKRLELLREEAAAPTDVGAAALALHPADPSTAGPGPLGAHPPPGDAAGGAAATTAADAAGTAPADAPPW